MKKFAVIILLIAMVCSAAFAAPNLGIHLGWGGRGANANVDGTKYRFSSGGPKLALDLDIPFNPDNNYSTVTGSLDIELDALFATNIKTNNLNDGKIITYKNLGGKACLPNIYLAVMPQGHAHVTDVFEFRFAGGLVGGFSAWGLKTIEYGANYKTAKALGATDDDAKTYADENTSFTKDKGFVFGLRFRLGFIFNLSEKVSIDILGTFDNYFYDANFGWEFKKNVFNKSAFLYGLDAKAGVTIKF